MPDAVVLDWEGVLTDTASARRDALLRALSEEGVCLNAEAYALQCDGQPLHNAVSNALAYRGRTDATLAGLVALRAARAAGVRTLALGAPAHVAVDADGAVDAINGLSLLDLSRLAGIATVERQP